MLTFSIVLVSRWISTGLLRIIHTYTHTHIYIYVNSGDISSLCWLMLTDFSTCSIVFRFKVSNYGLTKVRMILILF